MNSEGAKQEPERRAQEPEPPHRRSPLAEHASRITHQVSRLWRAPFFSPGGFVCRAAIITGLYLAVHLAGLREFTSLLNGTIGSVELGWRLSAILGLAYILIYLAFVLLVPILLLAAVLLALWQRCFLEQHPSTTKQQPR
jgi:hypothetical protein